MIEIRDMSKKYGDLTVFSHFDLTVQNGECVYLSGASGSGKTTLLRILCGFEKYTGTVNYTGKPAVVFQEPRLFAGQTVLENLLLVSSEEKKAAEKALSMLDKLGLAAFADAYPDELSGGMKQRVSLARALLSERADLFLDEPFSALDEVSKELSIRAIREHLDKTGGMLLLISHQKEDAERLCQRTVTL